MAKSASPETLSLDLADLSRPMITAPLLRSPDEVSQFAAYPPGYTAMWTIVTDLGVDPIWWTVSLRGFLH